jgi:hypothetical protein
VNCHHLLFREMCFGRLFFRFGGGRPLHNVQSLTSCSRVDDPTIHFSISGSAVFLKLLPDALSYLTCSCRLAPRFLMPLLHSGPFYRLLSTVGSLRLRRVIRLLAAANFFRDTPSPWSVSSLSATPYVYVPVLISVFQLQIVSTSFPSAGTS